jgi:hypothetical protein
MPHGLTLWLCAWSDGRMTPNNENARVRAQTHPPRVGPASSERRVAKGAAAILAALLGGACCAGAALIGALWGVLG